MKKRISLILIVLTAFLLLTGCGNYAEKIVGEWRLTSGDFAESLTFREDGSGTIVTATETKDFTYVLTDDTLTFRYPDIGHGVGYEVDGDILTVRKSTFERVG